MKFIAFFIFSIHLVFTPVLAQKNNWPYTNVSYAKAYQYYPEKTGNKKHQIIVKGLLTSNALHAEVKLNSGQSEKVITLVNSDINGLITGLSNTVTPHQAIVYFNEKNVPVASILFSFDAEGIILYPPKKAYKKTGELSKEEILAQQGRLSDFRTIFDEMGFPVFNYPVVSRGINVYETAQKLALINYKPIKQLKTDENLRFDLSGMQVYDGNVLAIADKEWNKYIYKIDTFENYFETSVFQSIEDIGSIDIEGIDFFENKFYLIDEYKSLVFTISKEKPGITELTIPWEKYNINIPSWGNKGLEGIAIDPGNKILYLAKEREPRNIFSINLETMDITEPFISQLKEGGGHDISELKFENGYLYYLERGLGLLTRINAKTGEKISVSFHELDYHQGQRFFKNENPQFGMAEAFILTPDEIWIGFDNNGDPVSEYGKSLGLTEGNRTAICIFKRPLGF